MSRQLPLISKSRYMSGLQCPKLLWCHYNDRGVFPPIDPRRQAIFDQGHRVGELARNLFPSGVLVSPDSHSVDDVLAETERNIGSGIPLYEAAFAHGGAYARVDILVPVRGGAWDLYEVKSTTRVKDEHIPDVAVQRHVLEGAGIKLRGCFLVHVNNRYVLDGDLDLAGLFEIEDVTAETEVLLPSVADDLDRMLEVIRSGACPDVDIGPQCAAPYECSLKPVCWEYLPVDSVTTLYGDRMKGFGLLEMGVTALRDIPEGFSLTGKQRVQVEAILSDRIVVDRERIRVFLDQLRYPVHYLDFEAFMPAVPLFQGTRPYQQIPFQFSCQVVPGPCEDPVPRSFLAEGPGDPREGLVAELKKVLGPTGSVVAFNVPFERGVLRGLVEMDTGLGEWVDDIEGRMVDLLIPFRSFAVYHPDQHGSASMKGILPALTGMDYGDLDIAEGMVASSEYFRVTHTDAPEEEREEVYRQLREYCDLDTAGMVKIVERLRELVDD